MDQKKLFERLKAGDTEACHEVMRTYGKRLYPRLYQRFGSRELADLAFKRTMLNFFDAVSSSEGEDMIETMLFAEANKIELQVSDGTLDRLIQTVSESLDSPRDTDAATAVDASPEAVTSEAACPREKKRHGIRVFGLILLVLLTLVLVWAVAGELMHMGLIPFMDIGYNKFRILLLSYLGFI